MNKWEMPSIYENEGRKYYTIDTPYELVEKDFYKMIQQELEKDLRGLCESVSICTIPKIKKVIFNFPATIVYWEDNTKTVVKINRDETLNWSEWNGIAMAILKKMTNNKYHKIIQEGLDKAVHCKSKVEEYEDNGLLNKIKEEDKIMDEICDMYEEALYDEFSFTAAHLPWEQEAKEEIKEKVKTLKEKLRQLRMWGI